MHELDITDGTVNFVTARKPAWHRLGTVFESEMTVTEALDAAHLAGWNVRKLAMTSTDVITPEVIDEDGVTPAVTRTVAVPDWSHVVRTNPVTGQVEGLGVVGNGFHHVQNEEHGEFLEALLDVTGSRFLTTAGALRGGRQVFFCAELPEGVKVGGTDEHRLFVTAMNGHDGSMALRVVASPVRVVCANTQYAAIRSAKQTFAIRHTKSAKNAIAAARQALDMTVKFNEAFAVEAGRMVDAPYTVDEFEALVGQVWPEKDDRSAAARALAVTDAEVSAATVRPRADKFRAARLDTLRTLFTSSPTIAGAGIDGTRWGAYNAITEYTDHYVNASGHGEDEKAAKRAAQAIGDNTSVKTKAWSLLAV